MNRAVVPLGLTVPATGVPLVLTSIVNDVSVVAFMVSLKVAVTDEETGIAVAPGAGTFARTVGGVVSAAEPVVKIQENGFSSVFPGVLVMAVDSLTV